MTQINSKIFSFYPYLLGIFLLFLSVFGIQSKAQNETLNSQSVNKAGEIISLSRKAMKGKNESVKINGLSITFSLKSHGQTTFNGRDPIPSEGSGEIQLGLSLPDKIKFSKSEEFRSEDNMIFYNYVLNGKSYNSNSYNIFKGKKLDSNLELTDEQKTQETLNVKMQNFLQIFPIILESASDMPLEFKYIGKAEANGEKADLLETVLPDESKLRLFFDEKSHLLRMLINTGKTRFGAEYVEKRFFSDYKERDGVLLPNKINIEKMSLTKTGKFERVEELTLKSIKFNPSFMPNFFEVKK